jgi:hypothetical protein
MPLTMARRRANALVSLPTREIIFRDSGRTEMNWRTATICPALCAAILIGASASLAQTGPHALPYGSGNWIGPGWYIYSPPDNNEQLEYGVYRSKEQCLSAKKQLNEDSNDELVSGGLPALPDPYLCGYFGVQPAFDQV